jgi:lipopolysaccharide export system permease protein
MDQRDAIVRTAIGTPAATNGARLLSGERLREPSRRSEGGDRAVTMGSIDKYIFRTTLTAFAMVLVSLTGVIWITQALRDIDLMTGEGQTILTFLGLTSLIIPALVLIISPIALMIAVSHTLNKLATDSEIIVMNAAGFSPFRLFRPFLYATCVVALLVAFISAYLAPEGLRRLKQWSAEITADVLTNILQPGRFAQLDQNLTIRIRERKPGGVLEGVFIDDRRDPTMRVTIVADHGTVIKNDHGSFLVLEKGVLQRLEASKRDPAMIEFDSNAFDMSQYSKRGGDVTLGIRERYVWELLAPADDDPMYEQLPGQFRAELHERFMAPVYPFAFAALTFAFLGAPRTTRQSRNFSIGGSILAVFSLRMIGFACSVMAVKSPIAPAVQYLMLFAAIGVSLWIILDGVVLEPPAALIEAINKSNARLLRLLGRPAAA